MDQVAQHLPAKIQAPQGTVLAVEHILMPEEGKIDTHIVLKGHPLPVLWRNSAIHHTTAPELTWNPDTCLYCQQCNQVCPRGCLHMTGDGLWIDREKCDACGDCLAQCPSMSLTMIGRRTTAGDLLHKTLKQNYKTANQICQITITGGEPGLQSAFCADLLFQIEAAGIPIILETSGLAPFDQLLPLLDRPQQIHFELVSTNCRLHTQLTGYGNDLILSNLKKISREIAPAAILVVRSPLIQGQTATEAEICQTGQWLVENLLPNCHCWELFEPLPACEETASFSQRDWARFGRWAAKSGFPEAKITLVDRENRQR